jgi:hypothetical protein
MKGKKDGYRHFQRTKCPLTNYADFPGTLRGKKKAKVFTSFGYVGPNTPFIIIIFSNYKEKEINIHAFF